MFNKILDGCHVKKASLEHTVKHTFKLKCERTSEDVDVPQQPVQFLLQACHGRDVEGNRVNGAAQNILCPNNPLPLVLFVREILRRSRTSCLTLQAALLYCARCKDP